MTRSIRSTLLGAATAAAVALGLAACGQAPEVPPLPLPSPAPSSTPQTVGPPLRVMPASVAIPKLGVQSDLKGYGLDAAGRHEVPPVEQPMQAGYYKFAAMPGDVGPAVLLGHINGGGRAGIFERIGDLEPGDEVHVTRTDGSVVRFAIYEVQGDDENLPKEAFPTERVYGDTEGPEIRLLSCGGEYDARDRRYLGSVIAYGRIIT